MRLSPRAIAGVGIVLLDAFAGRGEGASERAAVEPLIERALLALHEEDVPEALAACAELRLQWPDDPTGDLLEANVYQTRMRDYRTRAFEAEFTRALGRALALARQVVEEAPDARAHFVLGSARGYKAIHLFTLGEWFPALRDAVRANGDMKRAVAGDPEFVDPQLALALYDFWKSEKLGLGLGFCRGGRRTVVSRLESVWRDGRFLRVEAAYALQTVHLLERRHAEALAVNEWLRERFPYNPVALYHQGLILEAAGRLAESLAAWEDLVARLQAQPQPSHGFLAECHLHRAQLHARLNTADDERKAEEASAQAREHAERRDERQELEGPFVRFDQIRKSISRLPAQVSRGPLP